MTSTFWSWKAVWGCSYESLALYRILLGGLLTLELLLRFRYLRPFYSNEGTLPLDLLLPKVDDLYKLACIHCHFGSVLQQQVLLSVQVVVALLFTSGFKPKWTALLSWYLYFSLTLRNTWMNYILDRYFHYLLLHAIFLPTSKKWTMSSQKTTAAREHKEQRNWIVSPATISIKLLLFWIYLDAGGGKLFDPLGGWNYSADPLPALDTYTRHTAAARYVYALLGPGGLRVMTPVVVWIELLATPAAMLGCYLGHRTLTWISIFLICSLHVGIAVCLNNAALLSFVACVPWCVFLPIGWTNEPPSQPPGRWIAFNVENLAAWLCLMAVIVGSLWIDMFSDSCNQSVKHIWSTLLHNRWNVFSGAEEYVTWEIAPGLLLDGSVVDIWGRSQVVNWDLPGAGAPCTSTSRPGRWRSFPYLAELEGADGEALWGYLCKEWDEENSPDKKLIRYNFFMLQADVLPNMSFSATRKRLIHSHECLSTAPPTNEAQSESVRESENQPRFVSQSSALSPDDQAGSETQCLEMICGSRPESVLVEVDGSSRISDLDEEGTSKFESPESEREIKHVENE